MSFLPLNHGYSFFLQPFDTDLAKNEKSYHMETSSVNNSSYSLDHRTSKNQERIVGYGNEFYMKHSSYLFEHRTGEKEEEIIRYRNELSIKHSGYSFEHRAREKWEIVSYGNQLSVNHSSYSFDNRNNKNKWENRTLLKWVFRETFELFICA